jgi:DDE superfamily endonuclease
MPTDALASLFDVLCVFRPALTRPGLENFLIVAVGWIQTYGVHAVTEALVVTGVAGKRHHEAFHRFFSRGTWDPDRMGYWLFQRLLPFLGDGPVQIAIDDTLAPKKGAHVFGIGSHVDPVRSTKKHRAFCFAHCWVVLSVLIRVPFSRRTWALPVLFRLYRNLKDCEKHSAEYDKKTELAREMIDVFVTWTGERRVELAADCAYCNSTVTRGLPKKVVLFGAMRPDAVLTALPSSKVARTRGRPSKRGKVLPKPEAIAKDERRPWLTCTAMLYGRKTNVQYKTLCAQWYRACGVGLLRIVIVATENGNIPFRVFFCRDASVDVVRLLETYAGRWGIEVFFKEAKQLLGFADSCARKQASVLRVAPFVGLLYSALVIWFLEGAHQSPLAIPPLRPWYKHKRGLCFADILRAAQRALVNLDILDPANDIEYLPKFAERSRIPDKPVRRRAA